MSVAKATHSIAKADELFHFPGGQVESALKRGDVSKDAEHRISRHPLASRHREIFASPRPAQQLGASGWTCTGDGMRLEFGITPVVVDAIHDGMRGRLAAECPGAERQHVEAALDGHDVVSWWRDDRCIGAAIVNGQSVHLVFKPEDHGRWFQRDSFAAFLSWYFERHEQMRVERWTPEGERVMCFLGFKLVDGAYEFGRDEFNAFLTRVERRRIPIDGDRHVMAPEQLWSK